MINKVDDDDDDDDDDVNDDCDGERRHNKYFPPLYIYFIYLKRLAERIQMN
jgi:hypothetical protein